MTAGSLIGDGLALGDDLLTAVDRAVAAALRPLGGVRPDLACVFVSGGGATDSAAALERASAILGARNTIGCSAHGVIADGQGAEDVRGVLEGGGRRVRRAARDEDAGEVGAGAAERRERGHRGAVHGGEQVVAEGETVTDAGAGSHAPIVAEHSVSGHSSR